MTFNEFLTHCTACGGNWTSMMLTGIKEVAPDVWECMPDRNYEFDEIVFIVNHLCHDRPHLRANRSLGGEIIIHSVDGKFIFRKATDEERSMSEDEFYVHMEKEALSYREEADKSGDLASAKGFLRCVELAVGNGNWESYIMSDIYGKMLMDTMYGFLKKCFCTLQSISPNTEWELPPLRYESRWDRISSFASALYICTRYMGDVQQSLNVEAGSQETTTGSVNLNDMKLQG